MTATTLFNPFLRTCRAPEDNTPDGGTPPPATPPPADIPQDAPPGNTPPADTSAAAPPSPQEENADFSLDQEPPPEQEPAEPTGEETQTDPEAKEQAKEPEKEYILELPDDLEVTDEFRAILKEQAKDSGLDGKAAGKYVSSVIKAMEKAEADNIAQSTRELREEWGKNFNAHMKSVKEFAYKLRAKSGLSPQDLAPLQSPKGYRLLLALKQMVGEDTFVDGKTAPAQDPQKEAQRMLTDPTHKYFKAIQDPTDPLFPEANRVYNQLVGFPS